MAEFAARERVLPGSLTTRELGTPLQNGASRPFIASVSLTSFLQMRLPLRNLLSTMTNLPYVIRFLGAASRRKTTANELSRTIAGISRRTPENVTISIQGMEIHPQFAV